ncbi:putative ubiquitin-conjugating enzyme E2 38 isoform X1 [Amaranthus tricolor]|uniref:putative ubiquitin-conjugating enzyme E2 38 isoform X1 n=2 Tax=Amaranthus tricolor TaxID=29722 RepID=UPI002585F767|nr:putative ubiquitin-conjugating enzyme E2 38 isoform X1 [Amaranthus tricolor]
MEVVDLNGLPSSDSMIANKLNQEKDALSSDLVVSPAVLASVDDANVDSANAGKRSIGGSADNVGSASDLTFEDDAMDEEYDYLNDDDLSDTDVIDYEYNFYADDAEYLKLQAQFDCVDLPPGVEATVPWLQDPSKIEKFLASAASSSSASSSLKAATSSTVRMGEEIDDVLRKFIYFKQFDTVTDCSDHYFMNYKGSAPLDTKSWVKKIQDEWKILEQNLPENIYVRAYESQLYLLRAVIIGPAGTPYHDGLYVFDVFFPAAYPNHPPLVHFHSNGFRMNPNLYDCGKVCLSLLNTWNGERNEMWLPNKSTVLQLLVSIQALILNAEPFFNEPGYEKIFRGVDGTKKSRDYSEDVFIKSLKRMMIIIRNPPQHFEDLVSGHFRIYAHDVLTACKAYADGAAVGCNVKSWLQQGDNAPKPGSVRFKSEISKIMTPLVKCFVDHGSKDCDEFRS